jgi:hypothetical protein
MVVKARRSTSAKFYNDLEAGKQPKLTIMAHPQSVIIRSPGQLGRASKLGS